MRFIRDNDFICPYHYLFSDEASIQFIFNLRLFYMVQILQEEEFITDNAFCFYLSTLSDETTVQFGDLQKFACLLAFYLVHNLTIQ